MVKKRVFFAVIIAIFVLSAASTAFAEKRTDVNLYSSTVSTLDPHSTTLATDVSLHNQIYEGLVFMDDKAQPHMRVAEAFEVGEDGLTYTFRIRDNVKFHNGDTLTASDCAFSVKRAMTIANMANYVAAIEDAEALDDHTFVIKLKELSAPFLVNISQIRIISEKAVTDAGEGFGIDIVHCGTGPYKLLSYDPNVEIVLEAFEDYYRGEAPINRVNVKTITDESARLIAFETGELDFIAVPSANWNNIVESDQFTTYIAPSTKVIYFALNFYKGGVFENKKLRQAVHYALDRDAINVIAYDGIGEPAYFMCNPDYINCAPNDSFQYTYDVEKAKALIKEAGYPDGVHAGTLLTANRDFLPKVAQVLQGMLSEVGITCDIEILEGASASARGRVGDFDIYTNNNLIVLDMDAFSRFVHSRNLKAMIVKYDDPEIDDFFDRGAREMDVEKRKAIYKEADNWIKDYAAHGTLFYVRTPYAWNKDLNASAGLLYYYVYDWNWK